MNPSKSRTIGLLLAAILAGIAFFPSVSTSAAEPNISIVESNPKDAKTWGFQPPDISVKAGTTVVWRNSGSQVHSVTSNDGAFDSGDLKPGATWQYRFDARGEFAYGCTPHPFMTARVRVSP
jgi:plastocyanin